MDNFPCDPEHEKFLLTIKPWKLRLTDHVSVRWVEGLLYQGEVLFSNPSLDLKQVGVHPGLILKQEVNINFNEK